MLPAIIPEPVEFKEKDGTFKIDESIEPLLAGVGKSFEDLREELVAHDVDLVTLDSTGQINRIGIEGYKMQVSPEGISIRANSEAGCFHGLQSLRWLLLNGAETGKVQCCEIIDYPRFEHRGFMLDEARYFLGAELVRDVLDWMAFLKLNRFHWHLTEDQGWRIEIKKYPRLTEIGSKRSSTPMYRNRRPSGAGEENSDGTPHEGYYTQDEIAGIINHAKERFITIIPEIEMPGHATAALASYPEMRCLLPDDIPPGGATVFGQHLDGPDLAVSTRWGVHANTFCVGNPATMEFLKDILSEVASLFPGPIIHVGGDEVPKIQWMCCDRCQALMEKLGLSSEEELQPYFTSEIIDYLANLGKKAMLWNEHIDESLAERKEHVICQYWTGSLEKISGFLERGGKVVMSPSRDVYLDVSYHDLPLKRVYEYDPLGSDVLGAMGERAARSAAGGGILGVEAPLWGEVFKNRQQMEYCAFPRLFAIAEIAWTPADKKDLGRFMKKLPLALAWLDSRGINHASLDDADPTPEMTEKAKHDPDFGHYMYFS